MIVSLKWLKRYFTDLNASVLEVEKALTDVGLEVEGTKNKAEIYSKLVVGEVLTCEKHPDAEKLSITKLKGLINQLSLLNLFNPEAK